MIKNRLTECVVAFDPSYIKKSDKKTFGLGMYWSGYAAKSKWGLDICGFAAVDIINNTAFHLGKDTDRPNGLYANDIQPVGTPPSRPFPDSHHGRKERYNVHAVIPDDALVTVDSNMLLTVVRNLQTNAVKFTDSNGTITLSVEPFCRDGARPVSTRYTISIINTGIGMSEEQLRKLTTRTSAGERPTNKEAD